MRSRFLDDFVARAERARLNLHGVMVVQSAAILGEHHWIHDTPHELRSISKSFASCAVGIAIDEGARSLSCHKTRNARQRLVRSGGGARPAPPLRAPSRRAAPPADLLASPAQVASV